MHFHNFLEALKSKVADQAGYDRSFDCDLNIPGGEDICAQIFIQSFKSRGEIDAIPYGRVVKARGTTDIAHTSRAGVESNPCSERHSSLRGIKLDKLLPQQQG